MIPDALRIEALRRLAEAEDALRLARAELLRAHAIYSRSGTRSEAMIRLARDLQLQEGRIRQWWQEESAAVEFGLSKTLPPHAQDDDDIDPLGCR